MYFPYLRGRQEEVLALVEGSALSNAVLPIVEPFALPSARMKQLEKVGKRGLRVALIANSANGQPAPSLTEGMDAIESLNKASSGMVVPALELRASTPSKAIQTFAARFANEPCVIIHRDHVFSSQDLKTALGGLKKKPVHALIEGGAPRQAIAALPSAGLVLLRDGFKRQATNGAYPSRTHFDDLLFTYTSSGYQGFGDFVIVGDHVSVGGGAAKHVTLHLTEPQSGTHLVANHFVSTTPPKKGDNQAKYFSALDLLVKHTGKQLASPFNTVGAAAYVNSHGVRHFPNLGKMKRWSIMHHLELVDRELQARHVQPFI